MCKARLFCSTFHGGFSEGRKASSSHFSHSSSVVPVALNRQPVAGLTSLAARQMNMDYALSQALNYKTNGFSRAITFYDINCQYNKYLQDRVAASIYLSIPIGMDIIPAIGLWHVHGHQDSCYVRYASNFIPGTGRIDGEIMETLWAPLNIISPSARGMGTPHRKEVLDYQMNDCNFMKMIRMSK
jgi:hypothetical protein